MINYPITQHIPENNQEGFQLTILTWLQENLEEYFLTRNILIEGLISTLGETYFTFVAASPRSNQYRRITMEVEQTDSFSLLFKNLYFGDTSRRKYPWNKFRFLNEQKKESPLFQRAYDQDWKWLSQISHNDPVYQALDSQTIKSIMSWEGLPANHARPWLERAIDNLVERRNQHG